MTNNHMALISNLIFSAVIALTIIRTAKLIGKNDRSMTAVFFTFSASSFLLSYMYWFAYDLLRPDTRMPFAANEMGEMACNLLLASLLATVFGEERSRSYREAVLGIILQVGCVLLWIGWSGEWIQDIISGIILCYLVYVMINALVASDAFNGAEWRFQGIALVTLVALEGLIFAVPDGIKKPMDTVCYVIIIAMCAYYAIKILRAQIKGIDSKKLLSLSCIGFVYGMNAMYMSEEPIYYICETFDILMFWIVSAAVRRVVTEE